MVAKDEVCVVVDSCVDRLGYVWGDAGFWGR